MSRSATGVSSLITIPSRAEVHGGHTRCVDEALNAGLARQPQQLARAIDVGLVHGRGIGNPEAIICRHMHNRIAVLERGVQRGKSGEIANNGLPVNAFKIRKVRGLAREQAQIGAFCGESFGDMMPNESGCACDKDFHGGKCSFILNASAEAHCKFLISGCVVERPQFHSFCADAGFCL